MSLKSPEKKIRKLTPTPINQLKRTHDSEDNSEKKARKKDVQVEDKLQTQRRKNFITACESVSCKAYIDHRTRLQLVYLPVCASINSTCRHHKLETNINPIPSYAEESFKIEMKSNMWCEALEVCFISITRDQYLTANVLKDIVEIMLNAHEDEYAEYNISYLIDKCKQIFSQIFSTHPPCQIKKVRECYLNFLSSPMDLKENTFTNRNMFGCEKGVVKYCMNRLEYEVSEESKDSPLVNKSENIPEDMKESVKGLHWQKETFEIFELLKRTERIERLMSVLESIIELLQFDLAIWHSRYTNNLGSHVMRSHKPLMAYVLWQDNVLYTGAVNNNCRQILRLFAYFIHLNYPEGDIRIMTAWLNTIIQTFYICETNSNSDFPNTGKYCTAFANEFYKIISGMPHDSVMKIIERIQPTYMQNLIGSIHLKNLLNTKEDNVIKNLINFVQNEYWLQFAQSDKEIVIYKSQIIKPRKVKILKYLAKKLALAEKISRPSNYDINKSYPKFGAVSKCTNCEMDQNHVLYTFYITLKAYLDAYSVQEVQKTLENLNDHLLQTDNLDKDNVVSVFKLNSYTASENFIKKYRSIYQMLKELMLLLLEMKNSGKLPDNFKVFENIGLLGL